jgi:hypothetical protein
MVSTWGWMGLALSVYTELWLTFCTFCTCTVYLPKCHHGLNVWLDGVGPVCVHRAEAPLLHLLEAQGQRAFSNPTWSNTSRNISCIFSWKRKIALLLICLLHLGRQLNILKIFFFSYASCGLTIAFIFNLTNFTYNNYNSYIIILQYCAWEILRHYKISIRDISR